MRFAILLLACLGVGAVGVQSLPSFNRSTDDGKAITVTPRGIAWRNGVNGVVSVTDHGADPTGVSDSLAAFKTALAYASQNYCTSGSCSENVKTCTVDANCSVGRCLQGLCGVAAMAVHVPRGTYKLSDTLSIRQEVTIYGDGPKATILKPAAGKTGITVQAANTHSTGVGNGAYAEIRDLSLEPQSDLLGFQGGYPYALGTITRPGDVYGAWTNGLVFRVTTAGTSGGSDPVWPTSYGSTITSGGVTFTADWSAAIWLRAPAHIENVHIGDSIGFAGHGLQIIADVTGTPATNANGWSATRMFITRNRGDGVFTSGGDANRGELNIATISENSGYGVNDDGFLGNVWRNLVTQANVLGGYNSTDPNSRTMFVDCYSESDEPASKIIYPAMAIGGLYGNGFTSDSTGARFVASRLTGAIEMQSGNSTDGYVFTELNQGLRDDQIFGHKAQTNAMADISGTDLYFSYWRSQGLYRYDFGHGANDIAALIATGQADASMKKGQWSFPKGIGVGGELIAYTQYPLLRAGTAAPLVGTYKAGDIFLNSGASGTLLGWKCTVGGTPGTWVALNVTN